MAKIFKKCFHFFLIAHTLRIILSPSYWNSDENWHRWSDLCQESHDRQSLLLIKKLIKFHISFSLFTFHFAILKTKFLTQMFLFLRIYWTDIQKLFFVWFVWISSLIWHVIVMWLKKIKFWHRLKIEIHEKKFEIFKKFPKFYFSKSENDHMSY